MPRKPTTTPQGKSLDEIGLEIARAMADIDTIHADLLSVTDPQSFTNRRTLTTTHGSAMCALSLYEGYLSGLRAERASSVIPAAPLSPSIVKQRTKHHP